MLKIAIAALSIIVTLNLVFFVYISVRVHEMSGVFEELKSRVDSLAQQRFQTSSENTPEIVLHGSPTLEQNPVAQEAEREAEEILIAKQKRAYGKQVLFRFSDLIKNLDLDESKTREFVEIQLHFDVLIGEMERLSPYDTDLRREIESRREEAVAKLLDSDYVFYEEYVRTYEDRRQISFFSKRFLPASLDNTTEELLIAELSAVSENHTIPPMPRLDEDLGIRIEMGRKRFNAIIVADQEKIDRARSILTPEQLEGLKKYIDFQHKAIEDDLLTLELRLPD